MRILGRILFFIVLAAVAGIAGTFVAFWIISNGMPRALSNSLFLPLTVQVIGVLLFFSFSIFVFVKIFRLVFRWVKWSSNQSKASKTTSLICFAIAVYFFPYPINFVFRQGWTFISEILSSFPNLVLQSTGVESICATSSAEYCIGALAKTLLNGWNILVLNAVSRLRLDQFPFLDAIFLTALWLALANIVSTAHFTRRLAANARSFLNGSVENYRSISPTFRANALFVGILFVGAYLSFSSVIAIPSLQDAVLQDAHKPEELRNRLQSVALTKDKFDAHFPDISTAPFQASTKATADGGPKGIAIQSGAKSTDSTPVDSAKITEENISKEAASGKAIGVSPYLALLEKNTARRFATLRSRWNGLRENFRSSQLTVVDLATETFDFSNRGRKGVRETQQHFLSIDLWYRRWWAERAAALGVCRAAIEKFGADVGDLADLIETNLRAQPSNSSFFRDSDLGEFTKRQVNSEEAAQSACAISDSADYEIPLREDFGRYLGVFGIATQWLLKTESLSLVLITGLLGFGLLGAACSTFIRSVGKRSQDDPLVVNLTGVILRGASAAMMIFLGVYGGLAVFAGPNASPNPYVVLFACLVAAVYSEDAWAWGLREFNSRLASGDGSAAPDKPAATSTVPAQTSVVISEPPHDARIPTPNKSSPAGEAAGGELPEAGSKPVSREPPPGAGSEPADSEPSRASDESAGGEPSEARSGAADREPSGGGSESAAGERPEAGSKPVSREPPLGAGSEPADSEPSRASGESAGGEPSEARSGAANQEPPEGGGESAGREPQGADSASAPDEPPQTGSRPSASEVSESHGEVPAGSQSAERPADEGGKTPGS